MPGRKNGHREVLTLAWPIMVAQLSFTAMTVVDTLYISRLGTAEVAGTGVGWPLSSLLICMGTGLLSGPRILAAQAVGAGDEHRVRRLGWQALWAALGLGAVVALFAPLGWAWCALLGVPAAVVPHAAMFYGVRTASAPVVFLRFAAANWLNARGSTRVPMVTGLVANLLNVLLDPLLIFGWGWVPGLGVAGAMLATLLSLCVEVVLLFLWERPLLCAVDWRPERALLVESWRLGRPAGLQQALDVASWLFFVAILARVGEVHLAAHVIAVRVVLVSFLPGLAIAEATGVLVGQAVGAKDAAAAHRAWASGTRLALAFMVSCGIVFLLVPGPLVAVFHPTAEVALQARKLLYVAAVFQVFDGVATVGSLALAGAGDTRFVFWVTVPAAWLLKIPGAVFLAIGAGLGAFGAWLGLTLEIVFLAAAVLWRIRGRQALSAHPEDRRPVALAA